MFGISLNIKTTNVFTDLFTYLLNHNLSGQFDHLYAF